MNSAERHRVDTADLVARLLGVARRQFGMEMAWMSLFRDGDQVFEVIDRPDDSEYTLQPGDRAPLSESYCARVVRGELPNLISDTSENEITRDLAVTHELGIGSYAGTSVTDGDGQTLGMICCIDPRSAPQLEGEALRILEIIAGVVSEVIAANVRCDDGSCSRSPSGGSTACSSRSSRSTPAESSASRR